MNSVETKFVASQSPSFDAYLVIEVSNSYDNFMSVDQMKKFRARLVSLIFTDKHFARDKRKAWVKTWFKGKDY